MRSPALTHFRWWPRNLPVANNVSGRIGYATLTLAGEETCGCTKRNDFHDEDGRDRSARWHPSEYAARPPQHNPGTRSMTRAIDAPLASGEPVTGTGNTKYWLDYIQQQRLRHGTSGLEDAWKALREAKHVLRPIEPLAQDTWNLLITAFLDQPVLLEELVRYAGHVRKSSGGDFRFLYDKVMQHLLREEPDRVASTLVLLHTNGLAPFSRAGNLVAATVTSKHIGAAFKAFEKIYESGTERNLYETCFNALRKTNASYRTIYRWHTLLLSHGDLPHTALLSDPVVRILLTRSQRLPFAKDLIIAPSHSDESGSQQARFTREYMSTVVGEVHGIKQKSVSDDFCARVLATGGLSTSFIIGGLAMLGLDIMGPLAMRELAARSRTTKQFLESLDIVRERKIAISPCVFSNVLQRFALEDRQDVFSTLIQSDRHPDTYEDNELMQRLADNYLNNKQLHEAHALLAVLSITVRRPQKERWNMLAQAECRSRNAARISAIIQEMTAQRYPIYDGTMACLRSEMLRPRAEGKRPRITGRRSNSEDDDLSFVTNMLLAIANAGNAVDPSHWREVIKRYGMEGRMSGLRSLVLELMRLHADKPTPAMPEAQAFGKASLGFDHPLRQLFNASLQRAIVAWGFHSEKSERWLPASLRMSPSDSAADEPWLRGLRLLLVLQEAGLPLDLPAVRKEVVKQLAKLYRPRVAVDMASQHVTTSDDAEVLRRHGLIEHTWGSKGLFRFAPSPELGNGRVQAQHTLSCLFIESGWLRRQLRRLQAYETHQIAHED